VREGNDYYLSLRAPQDSMYSREAWKRTKDATDFLQKVAKEFGTFEESINELASSVNLAHQDSQTLQQSSLLFTFDRNQTAELTSSIDALNLVVFAERRADTTDTASDDPSDVNPAMASAGQLSQAR
jgi:hypothetical protein